MLSLVLAAGLAALPLAARAQTPVLPKSLSVELPADHSMFPDGPGVAVVTNNCLACHSAGMVLYQPALPKAAWEAEVKKMRETFKAPVAAEDVPAIVAYLVHIKGAE
ncbi:MAG: cytochrome c [Alphaproteobacteria bacterium]|nr:cytochrome c [Alphaproteobacteria bacterium]